MIYTEVYGLEVAAVLLLLFCEKNSTTTAESKKACCCYPPFNGGMRMGVKNKYAYKINRQSFKTSHHNL